MACGTNLTSASQVSECKRLVTSTIRAEKRILAKWNCKIQQTSSFQAHCEAIVRKHGIGVLVATCLIAALPYVHAQDNQCDPQRSACPQAGFVPDEKTAVRIAEAVLMPIYGEGHIKSERPFTARLEGNRWIVKGTLPKPRNANEIIVGGTAMAEIDKMDGRIIAIYHLK
jgi:hypothetical protein